MTNREETHYFRIGLFLFVGLIVLIGLILIFNSSVLFKKEVLVETYFNESVQGLIVGSPVKYRGITVGTVKEIDFVGHEYNLPENIGPASRYIYVLVSITSSFLTDVPEQDLQRNLKHDIAAGLRVKMALQDLTGNAYLEINFMDPKQNPVLPIYWEPKNYYIPSTTSILTRFSDNVQNILQGLQSVNFQKFFDNAQDLMKTANQTMDVTRGTVTQINRVLTMNQSNVSTMLQNLNVTAENLRQLSSSLKANPSKIIFGKPPALDPGKL